MQCEHGDIISKLMWLDDCEEAEYSEKAEEVICDSQESNLTSRNWFLLPENNIVSQRMRHMVALTSKVKIWSEELIDPLKMLFQVPVNMSLYGCYLFCAYSCVILINSPQILLTYSYDAEYIVKKRILAFTYHIKSNSKVILARSCEYVWRQLAK